MVIAAPDTPPGADYVVLLIGIIASSSAAPMWFPASSLIGARPNRSEFVDSPVIAWRSLTKSRRYPLVVSRMTLIGMTIANRLSPLATGSHCRQPVREVLSVIVASAMNPTRLRQMNNRSLVLDPMRSNRIFEDTPQPDFFATIPVSGLPA